MKLKTSTWKLQVRILWRTKRWTKMLCFLYALFTIALQFHMCYHNLMVCTLNIICVKSTISICIIANHISCNLFNSITTILPKPISRILHSYFTQDNWCAPKGLPRCFNYKLFNKMCHNLPNVFENLRGWGGDTYISKKKGVMY
jgi:hypothetical protein